jgi:hypothetical protein
MHNRMTIFLVASIACSMHTTQGMFSRALKGKKITKVTKRRGYACFPSYHHVYNPNSRVQQLLTLAKEDRKERIAHSIESTLKRISSIEQEKATLIYLICRDNIHWDQDGHTKLVQDELRPNKFKSQRDVLDKQCEDYNFRLAYYKTLNTVNNEALHEAHEGIHPLSFDCHNVEDLKCVLFYTLWVQHLRNYSSKNVVRYTLEDALLTLKNGYDE